MVMPEYCRDFHCIASRCRHNCCIGWEIDIDPETAERYRALTGEEWTWLHEGIGEDPPHFILDGQERCPCLREDGLCRLILTLGEESLCQICRDHPRFRNFWPGRTELGLGACCEEAARLILRQTEPLRLTEDGSEIEGEEARALYALREALLSLAFSEDLSLQDTERALLRRAGAGEIPGTPGGWAKRYLSLERLDEAWTDRLLTLTKDLPDPEAFDLHMRDREREYRNMLAYFLYRHLPEALEDGAPGEKAAFAVLSVHMLRALGAAQYARTGEFTPEDQAELFRAYSAEIEYSDENPETLYALLRQETEIETV